MRRLSLRYKFLLLTSVILGASIAAYLALAIRLFDRDKTAYIYDNNAALVETLAEEAAASFTSSIRTLRLMHGAYARAAIDGTETPAMRALLDDDDQIVEVTLYTLLDGNRVLPRLTLVNEDYLAPYGLSASDLESKLGTLRHLPIPLLLDRGLHFEALALGEDMAVLSMALALPRPGGEGVDILVASLRQDRRLQIFQRSSVYTAYLVDAFGKTLAHSEPAKVTATDSLADAPFVATILKSPVAKGVQQFTGADGTDRIVAYKKLGLGGLVAVSEIPVEKAFLASRRLVEQTLQFAVLILCLAFLVTMLFTKRLTAALQKLYAATQRVAQGDLDVSVDVRTGDEVGALSRSFQHMTGEIKRLLVETRDKARMEKELETAQLVQDNFFPKDHLRIGDFEIAAYFKPASECGGDWWGSIQLEDQLILLLGDATGHGVPAALMTAAAHSCTSTLARLSQTIKGLKLTPAFIMDHLNAAIFHAGKGRIKMTFFVAVIDLKTGEMRYVNASHDMPVVCRDPSHGVSSEPATREHLETLSGHPDPLLGQSLSATYQEHVARIGVGEVALYYTDGLVEGRNGEGEEFGEGRLMRAFAKTARASALEIRDDLVQRATGFFAERAPDDDLTLIVVKRSLPEQAKMAG